MPGAIRCRSFATSVGGTAGLVRIQGPVVQQLRRREPAGAIEGGRADQSPERRRGTRCPPAAWFAMDLRGGNSCSNCFRRQHRRHCQAFFREASQNLAFRSVLGIRSQMCLLPTDSKQLCRELYVRGLKDIDAPPFQQYRKSRTGFCPGDSPVVAVHVPSASTVGEKVPTS